MTPFVLFIVSPGLSATVVGWALGKPLLENAQAYDSKRSAIRGAVVGSAALMLFAPLFAVLYVLTEPPGEHWNIFGLAILVLVGGFVAVWWLVVLTGAAVGWALNRLASVDVGRGN